MVKRAERNHAFSKVFSLSWSSSLISNRNLLLFTDMHQKRISDPRGSSVCQGRLDQVNRRAVRKRIKWNGNARNSR